MKFFQKITIPLFCFLSITTTLAQTKEVKSVILSKADTSRISGAHILNVVSKVGTISNQKGEFLISANTTDTLIISFVGYASLKFTANTILPVVYLEKETYQLDPFWVSPYKDFNAFKKAFIALELKETTHTKLNTSFKLSVAELKSWSPSNLISGGITDFAAKFNTLIQDKKRYERLIKRDEYERFIATKFNAKVVRQATPLTDVQQINVFISYCDFSNEFIETSSKYELYHQVLECYDEFNSLSIKTKAAE